MVKEVEAAYKSAMDAEQYSDAMRRFDYFVSQLVEILPEVWIA